MDASTTNAGGGDSCDTVHFWRRPGVVGTCLGLLSAIAYTTANLGLRHVAPGGDLDWAIFVSANKAAPVACVAWALVLWRSSRGLPGLPPRNLVVPLFLTGLVMQFGGNVVFQFALSRGGLALTVPLTFSAIIVSGAALGRILLKEPITPRILAAMATMMAAVAVLSQGAETASAAVMLKADWHSTVLAVASACLSGVAYGSCGVMIRRCVTGNLSNSATVVLISSIGPLVLWPIALIRLGPSAIGDLPLEIWLSMLGAGAANAVAFFAISAAYRRLSVVRVNLLNASQAAMAAIAGVMLFAEPNTPWLQAGTGLTVLGLIVSAVRKGRSSPPPAPPIERSDARAPSFSSSHPSRLAAR